ncbi:MFS transporter [uncultured Clostridium sp.]|uniref:MFS transporter n=1 Tax=uncultured Clostridium sp. TaxID=59620 RepID=UPI0025CD955E|nr:MFS transporter [uncultured Clostridium sp.]
MEEKNGKLSFRTKLSYGVAAAGDAAIYNFVSIYFLFYLTTVAGIDPAKAGTLSSLSLLIGAVATIFVGYLSDNSSNPHGRRRPFIRIGLPLFAVSFVLMHSKMAGGSILYYGIFATLFWSAYAIFYVPYTALGAEITDDYDDRTRLRTFAAVGSSAGNYFGMVFPLLLVSLFGRLGKTTETSWSMTAVIIVLFAAIMILTMLRATRGKERVTEPAAGAQKPGIFKDYLNAFQIKPMKYLILSIIFTLAAYTIYLSSVAFFITYNLNLPESYSSTIFLVACIFIVIYAPFIDKVATAWGKKQSFILCMAITSVLMIVMNFIGIRSHIMLLIFAAVHTLGASVYWQLASAILYDLTEVIELKFNKRSEGTLSSLQSICQQVGTSFGMLIMGWILKFSGFQEGMAAQSAGALSGVQFLLTIVPAVGYLIAAAMMFLFPLTKKRYELVQKAIEEKNQTGQYSLDGLEQIV